MNVIWGAIVYKLHSWLQSSSVDFGGVYSRSGLIRFVPLSLSYNAGGFSLSLSFSIGRKRERERERGKSERERARARAGGRTRGVALVFGTS